MKIVNINVQEPYYSDIITGKKIVEGRLNRDKFFNLQIGDILKINNKFNFKVVAKNIYTDFRKMIEKEGVENVLPDKRTVDDALAIYYKFYSKEDEKKYGVVGIKIVKTQLTQ